jgi:PAS domain S-box-containing protein
MDKVKTLIRSSPVVIAIIYIVVGFLWIQFSDQLVLAMFEDPESITRAQSLKGWLFVTASGLLIFFLVLQSNNMLGEIIHGLNRINKKFESTLENAPIGIAHHSPDENWFEVNQTLCNLFGYEKDELMRMKFSDLIHPDDIERGRKLDAKLASGEIDFFEIEKRYIRKDGSQFPGLARKTAVYDNKGSTPYLIVTLQDISNQKKYEEEIKKSLHEKEVLLTEVHHRVKNNLALISALFELQNLHTNDKKLQSILGKSNIRIKCLSLIHESFSQNEESADIQFGDFLEQLLQLTRDALNTDNLDVIYQTEISPVSLNINIAIPVSLIFTEWMMNIFDVEFKDKEPMVRITLKEKGENIDLSISCSRLNGLKEKMESDPKSLTFIIIDTLVKQIKGEVNYETDDERFVSRLRFKNTNLRGTGSFLTDNEILAISSSKK